MLYNATLKRKVETTTASISATRLLSVRVLDEFLHISPSNPLGSYFAGEALGISMPSGKGRGTNSGFILTLDNLDCGQ